MTEAPYTSLIGFHEFCHAHSATEKECFDLAHYLAGLRYKRTIQLTIGASAKIAKAGMQGVL